MTQNIERIKEVYYDPKTGYVNATKLYERLKKHGVSRKEVADFLKNQKTSQVFKEERIRTYPQITTYAIMAELQMDLIDIKNKSRYNKGIKFLICIVDIFSRYAWVLPIKNKTEEQVVKALSLWLSEIGDKPIPSVQQLTSDNGSEFVSRSVSKLCKDKNIRQRFIDAGHHNSLAVIDRFCRTIKTLIEKYLYAVKTNKYIDVLDDLVENYNSSIHSTINVSPYDVLFGTKAPDVVNHRGGYPDNPFQEGDRVRIRRVKGILEKGYIGKYSKDVYEIAEVKNFHCKLRNKAGTVLKKKYMYYMLQKVDKVEETPSKTVVGDFIPLPSFQKQKADKEVAELREEGGDVLNPTRRPKTNVYVEVPVKGKKRS